MANFFAVTKSGRATFALQRIRLQRNVQVQLTDLFDEQANDFVGVHVNSVGFTPTYTIANNEEEVFAILNFDLPEFLVEALNAPQGIPDLEPFQDDSPQVKAIVGVDADEERFFFQYFERQRILESRRLLIFRNNVFNSVEEPAVTVDNRLAATIVDGELRFKSFHRVRQFLDLSAVFSDATDDSIRQVLQHPKLICDNPDQITARMSNRLRKRFANLIATGILEEDSVTPQLIQTRCRRYSGLENIGTRGRSGQRRLILPEELSTLEKLIRFMCEELYVGDLTGQERLTNSSRIIQQA